MALNEAEQLRQHQQQIQQMAILEYLQHQYQLGGSNQEIQTYLQHLGIQDPNILVNSPNVLELLMNSQLGQGAGSAAEQYALSQMAALQNGMYPLATTNLSEIAAVVPA